MKKTLLAVSVLLVFCLSPQKVASQGHDDAYLAVRHVWRVGVQHGRDVNHHYHYLQYLCEKDRLGGCEVRAAIVLFR